MRTFNSGGLNSPPHTHTKRMAKETTLKHPSENELVLTVSASKTSSTTTEATQTRHIIVKA
jgi:hypothetical protein